jgi:hypothetical protein
VTPLVVSYVSNEEPSAQGVRAVVDSVNVMTARTSVRTPVAPTLVNGRLAEKIWPVVIVKFVALPMVAPVDETNEMLPVQDAAVPVEDAAAVLTRFTCAVSELASPIGGVLKVWVTVDGVVCAKAFTPCKHVIETAARANRRRKM